jgi:hypothetical protein
MGYGEATTSTPGRDKEEEVMEELKPCPFCGSDARSSRTDIGRGYQTSFVKCTKCPANIGKSGLDAEVFWNTRTKPVDIEKVEKLLSDLVVATTQKAYAIQDNRYNDIKAYREDQDKARAALIAAVKG